MVDLPAGTITFLLTDVEGSTKLWELYPEAMNAALRRHDELALEGVARHSGRLIRSKGEGDSVFAVFSRASDAVSAAADLQGALSREPWPSDTPIRVRMGLHTGEAEYRDGDYYGTAVNRCARIRAIAHGGQVLVSHAAAELARELLPDEIALKYVGLHRLKDLSQAERIFQLVHPGLPDDFPPLKSLDVQPNNLPQQLTSFVGRERELADLRKLLRSTRLLTLSGAGGCGKTRLALQAAADSVDEYADGVWLVELGSLSDPALVAREVARAVKVREDPGGNLVEALVQRLSAGDSLLLLDNCEHMVAACAQLVESLLKACAGLTVLATSREALNIAGETVFPLAPLSLPDPKRAATPENLTHYESVRLFIDRAVSVMPSFAVDNANAPAVAQICHRLDGIPLAIELAAARIRTMPVEQIAERLDDRFRLLTGGKRTALPRQQTLKALTEWSYDLLTEAEKTLFRRLSVFAGGWTLDGAEAVCAGEAVEAFEVLDLLAGLGDKSLVVYETGGGVGRHGMLETIRQFAFEALEASGELDLLKERHLAFVLALAKKADPDQEQWRQRLTDELQNLLIAHRTCDRIAGGADLGLRLVAELSRFFGHRGDFGLELRMTLEALARPGADPKSPARVVALRAASWAAYRQGKYEIARTYGDELVAIMEEQGDPARMVDALRLKAAVAQALGAESEALAALNRALALAQELPDEAPRFGVANSLGEFHRAHGDYEEATKLYREALAISRRGLTPYNVAVALGNLVAVLAGDQSREEARAMLIEALECAHAAASPRLIVALVDLAANLAGEAGRWEASARLRGAAEEQMSRMAMRRDFADERAACPIVEQAKQALGAEAYAAAAASGRELPFDEAVAEAREWLAKGE